jgi:hypothetical protein
MLQGSCHCGGVRITLPAAPARATSCNCSLCRRLGALWVYYEFGTVIVAGHPENTVAYVWGDRMLRTLHCRTCGVVTHWEPLPQAAGIRHGVNLRLFDPDIVAAVPVRRMDGADTWEYLD